MGFFDFFKGKDKREEEENESQAMTKEGISEPMDDWGIKETETAEKADEAENEEEDGRASLDSEENTNTDKAGFETGDSCDGTPERAQSPQSIVDIVKEVVEELEEEAQETIDEDTVRQVIQNVEDIEEEVAGQVLNEITESVEEIVLEVVGEITEETKEAVEEEVVDQVICEVKDIEEKVREEVCREKGIPTETVASHSADENEQAEPTEKKKGFFARLLEGLDKTRKSILGGVDSVLGSFTKIDEDLFEELEEVLIMADIGVETTMGIIENLRKRVKSEKVTEPQMIKGLLIDEITQILREGYEEEEKLKTPSVILVIGVNGVGKTTTIGKLASSFKSQGQKVLLAAADTFRAAAIDQLEIWGQRSGIDVIKHEENSDPAAVVFDAVNAAKNRKTDILICDTAGRLHNKKNLMEELKKIAKVIDREYPEANKEVYLVLDATTGQNAMQQAKLFQEVADLTGIILTKLDGTAKGGIVIAIKSELKIPVRYIGVGEGIGDLQRFDAGDFAAALFGEA